MWTFAQAVDGMTVHDRATGQARRYLGGWQEAAAVAVPTGGATVDEEARAAIAELVAALVSAGLLQAA